MRSMTVCRVFLMKKGMLYLDDQHNIIKKDALDVFLIDWYPESGVRILPYWKIPVWDIPFVPEKPPARPFIGGHRHPAEASIHLPNSQRNHRVSKLVA